MIYGLVAAMLAEALIPVRVLIKARSTDPDVYVRSFAIRAAVFSALVTAAFGYATGLHLPVAFALFVARFALDALTDPIADVFGLPSVARSVERSALNELPLEVAALDYALNVAGETTFRLAAVASIVVVAWEVVVVLR